MPPHILASIMPAREFYECIEFYQLEPWGPERDNLHAAIIAATIANVHRGENQEPFSVSDFMFKNEHQQAADEAEKQRQYVNNLMTFFEGIKPDD